MFRVFFLLMVLLVPSAWAEELTDSHVYQQVQRINNEIRLIRQALKVENEVRQPGVLVGKRRIHVLGKGAEVLEKLAAIQRKKDIKPLTVPELPVRRIKTAELFAQVETILAELQRIKQAYGISQDAVTPVLYLDKTPSDIYEVMWQAAFLLEGVAPELSNADLQRGLDRVDAELKLIADKLSVDLAVVKTGSVAQKSVMDINLHGYMNLHRIVRLERNVRVSQLRVPSYPAGEISGSDVYDTINMMLAELNRIKQRLKLKQVVSVAGGTSGNADRDAVFNHMYAIGQRLELLIKATQK